MTTWLTTCSGWSTAIKMIPKKLSSTSTKPSIDHTFSGLRDLCQRTRLPREVVEAQIDQANISSYSVNVRRGFVLAAVFPLLGAVGGLGTAILVYLGGLGVINALISAGAWYLFLTSLDSFFFPILNLAAFSAQVQAGLSAAERIFALIESEPSVVQTDNLAPPKLQGDICFDALCFRYTEQEQVLDRFDLHIRKGENVALVGHTGAGKSSIARLIARFYEFQAGRILVDGQDIRSFDLTDYRSQLGTVSQTPFLFSGTVSDNIRYARANATDQEIVELARQIDPFSGRR